MTKTIYIGLFICFFVVTSFSQTPVENRTQLNAAELFSPWVVSDGKMLFDLDRSRKHCFDLILLDLKCDGPSPMTYGNRFGENWDILTIVGIKDSRSRMIDLGKYEWTDLITIPNIEPWPTLKPGERRKVTVDASGVDGRDGSNGEVSTNGSYETLSPGNESRSHTFETGKGGLGTNNIDTQLSTDVRKDEIVKPSGYTPFNEAKKGHIFAAHVVVPGYDSYVLIRVDDLERGNKITISWKKVVISMASRNL